MQCPNCGGHMGLEDAYCPYCGSRNTFAVQHQSDMARYRNEYERTQQEVLENTSFVQRNGSWLVMLVILLIALMVGLGLQFNAWDIGYSIREKNVQNDMPADKVVLDTFLEQGDYSQFVGYYDANNLYLGRDDSYQAVHKAANAYTRLLENLVVVNNPDAFPYRENYISDVCGYMAEEYNDIFTLEEQFSYNREEYLPDSMRVYVDDIRERAGAIAITYLGFTPEDVEKIPSLSKRKLAQMIEEGIAS